jgi:3-hydroxyacyl-[acyl-carrier-protein] dehydratase
MDDVRAALPHREPFLFVDRILEREPSRIVTEWRADPESAFFRGHYPGRPLVPGVLLCECALQAGAVLCAGDDAPAGAVPVVTKIAEARFRRMVRPGETVRCEVALDERVAGARYMTAKLSCAGESVLRLQFVVAVAAPAPAGGA